MANRTTPGLRKLPSGRWQARPVIDGVCCTLGSFDTKAAATEALNEAKGNPNWVSVGDGGIPLRDFAVAWTEGRRRIAPGTRTSYNNTWNNLGWLGSIKLRDLTAFDINRAISEWERAGRAPSYIKTRWVHIKTALNAAIKQKLIRENVATDDSVELPLPRRAVRRYLTYAELTRVTDAIEDEVVRDLLWTMAWSGFRFHEAVGLTPDQFSLKRGIFLLDQQWSQKLQRHVPLKARTATDAPRMTPIVDDLVPILQRRSAGGFMLFLNGHGRPFERGTIQDRIDAACKATGIKRFTPHDLRHTCASWLHAAGVPLNESSEWLGHKTTKITSDTYTNLWGSQMDAARDKMSAVKDVDLGPGLRSIA